MFCSARVFGAQQTGVALSGPSSLNGLNGYLTSDRLQIKKIECSNKFSLGNVFLTYVHTLFTHRAQMTHPLGYLTWPPVTIVGSLVGGMSADQGSSQGCPTLATAPAPGPAREKRRTKKGVTQHHRFLTKTICTGIQPNSGCAITLLRFRSGRQK